MMRSATKQITKNLETIRKKLAVADTPIKDVVMTSFAKSLLLYFGTPLVAAGIWKKEDIVKLEKRIYRESYRLPSDQVTSKETWS